MSWNWRRLALAAVMLPGLLHPSAINGQAQEIRASAEGWVRPAADGATSLAGLTIQNDSAYTVYITSATTDAAGRVELRDGRQKDPARQVPKFLSVPAFGSLAMESGGAHLALVGLKRPLAVGATVAVTLRTDQGINIAGQLRVRTP